jgi:hypothetical protein
MPWMPRSSNWPESRAGITCRTCEALTGLQVSSFSGAPAVDHPAGTDLQEPVDTVVGDIEQDADADVDADPLEPGQIRQGRRPRRFLRDPVPRPDELTEVDGAAEAGAY